MQAPKVVLLLIVFTCVTNAKIQSFVGIKCESSFKDVTVELCEVSRTGTLEILYVTSKPLTEIFVSANHCSMDFIQ